MGLNIFFIYLYMEKKEILWSILVKYDGVSNLEKFCDAISNFIKGNQNTCDIINIYKNLSNIDISDKFKINVTIGMDIDCFLFDI